MLLLFFLQLLPVSPLGLQSLSPWASQLSAASRHLPEPEVKTINCNASPEFSQQFPLLETFGENLYINQKKLTKLSLSMLILLLFIQLSSHLCDNELILLHLQEATKF